VQQGVDVPGLVGDHQVVVLLADDVGEDHEVGDQHLVHPPDRLEGVQVVLAGLLLDVRGLAGQPGRGRVHPLAVVGQHPGDRVLGQPVHLDAGVQLPQLGRDRDVALGVPEADR
jgi:hypothetical protein